MSTPSSTDAWLVLVHELSNPLAGAQSNLDFARAQLDNLLSQEERVGSTGHVVTRDPALFGRIREALHDAQEGLRRATVAADHLKSFTGVSVGRGPVDLPSTVDAALAAQPSRRVPRPIPMSPAIAPEALLNGILPTLLARAPAELDELAGQVVLRLLGAPDVAANTIVEALATALGATLRTEKDGLWLCWPAANAVEAERPARVLVVDDEALVSRALQRMLREHQVVVARSAELAETLLQSDRDFDLVLCDLMMDGMTGMDLYRIVARHHPDLAARFVFMTGGAYNPEVRSFLGTIRNEVLEKPFDAARVRQMVATRTRNAARLSG